MINVHMVVYLETKPITLVGHEIYGGSTKLTLEQATTLRDDLDDAITYLSQKRKKNKKGGKVGEEKDP